MIKKLTKLVLYAAILFAIYLSIDSLASDVQPVQSANNSGLVEEWRAANRLY